MSEYLKKRDVINAMEENSHTVEVFGTTRKMIDGMMMCMSIADMEVLEVEEESED